MTVRDVKLFPFLLREKVLICSEPEVYDPDMSRVLELSVLSEQEALELALKESANMISSTAKDWANGSNDRASWSQGKGVSFEAMAKTYNGYGELVEIV